MRAHAGKSVALPSTNSHSLVRTLFPFQTIFVASCNYTVLYFIVTVPQGALTIYVEKYYEFVCSVK